MKTRMTFLLIVTIVLAGFSISTTAPQPAEAIILDGCDYINKGLDYDSASDKGYHTTTVMFYGGEVIAWNLSANGATASTNEVRALIPGLVDIDIINAVPTPASTSGSVVIPSAGSYDIRFYAYNPGGSGPVSALVTCNAEPPIAYDQQGLIKILTSQAQPVYESAAGNVIRNADSSDLQIPQDYDGNGYDTYVITGSAEIDGVQWYAIWLGSESWGWVPSTNVTVLQ